ncbi:MAG TPA: hypothetical protein VNL14_15030 [Candidatus Acidoferrales bacterium]|nr:hypothetical protein [Candidatus Acidoferrales bacterium]
MPLEAHIKEHPAYFHRFDVLWTPTVLILDPSGAERRRLEGYLPNAEFRAELEMGLARVAFMQKQWGEAERRYAEIVKAYPAATVAPEALYWRQVSRYKATSDHAALSQAAVELKQNYPASVWTQKASVWLH